MNNIVFAGLGSMGIPMATNLRAAGMQVHGLDVDRARAEQFNGLAERQISEGEALAGADGLVIMVVNAAQVRDLLFKQEMVSQLPAGACIVQMSTVAPGDSAAISAEVKAFRDDLHYVDAPVSGGVAGARDGSLTIMVAAGDDAFTACRPIFEAMGRAIYRAGTDAGQGSTMKAVNQLLCGVHIAVAAEAMAMAEKNGLDLAVMLEMLSGSAASSWMIKDRGPRMILPPDEVTSAVDIFCKDLGIVCESAAQSRTYTPLAHAAHQLFVASSERGEGQLDDSQVIRTYRLLNGSPSQEEQ
ncbi:oxidoreductase [Halomonas cupida]|uniref:3-hydroxyisobutyrate dehydrogenase n=1 Tax=Halomonas cupida TaxID=44933 RepID=A0A1M6ZHF5_9GAMM|nr:NAD(P)-dependent oxidoreductase [Halomonas cupida]GEN24363.1 oxidoreductase [Halomonas cupida]SHL29870.1 3-hydroxyisobutyrate dehydrogenase [Halomonas cupida]